jgi:hypothetical protein
MATKAKLGAKAIGRKSWRIGSDKRCHVQSNGYFGNVEVEWRPEEGEFTPVDPATREVNLIAKKSRVVR